MPSQTVGLLAPVKGYRKTQLLQANLSAEIGVRRNAVRVSFWRERLSPYQNGNARGGPDGGQAAGVVAGDCRHNDDDLGRLEVTQDARLESPQLIPNAQFKSAAFGSNLAAKRKG